MDTSSVLIGRWVQGAGLRGGLTGEVLLWEDSVEHFEG